MTLPAPPTGLYPEDYERIEAAVMETVRGRWFLLEYARRQRAEETERLVVAVDRLERVAARVEAQEAAADWRLPRRLVERAQEFARTLRASGVDEMLCAQADALAEQFSKLLDAPAAMSDEASRAIADAAPVEIVVDYEVAEFAAASIAIRPVAAAEPIEVAQAEFEPIDSDPLEVEPVVAEEPVAFEPQPVAGLEEERIAGIGDAPAFAEAPAIRPDEVAPPKSAPAQIVDPRLAALSRLDHLTLHEKLRLFG